MGYGTLVAGKFRHKLFAGYRFQKGSFNRWQPGIVKEDGDIKISEGQTINQYCSCAFVKLVNESLWEHVHKVAGEAITNQTPSFTLGFLYQGARRVYVMRPK